MKKMKKIASFGLAALMVLGLAACGGNGQQGGGTEGNGGGEATVDSLTFVMLPNEAAVGDERDAARDLLVEDMSEALGIPVEIIVADDYNATIETMRTGQSQIAHYGPFSYIIAAERANAEAIAVVADTEEDAYYQSYLIVNADSDIQSIDDIKGRSMSFVDPASTSGNLIPRATIAMHFGIAPEEIDDFFSSTQFSGSHQNNLAAIENGAVEVAAVASNTFSTEAENGNINPDDFRIIAESDPIPIDPVAISGDLPDDLIEQIKDFFYNYDNQEYFENTGFDGTRYLPIEDSNYDYIRDVAESMNMSPEELLS